MVTITIDRETDGSAWIEQQAVLDGVTYTLELMWNVRCNAWFMHVWDIEGAVLYQAGIKLVPGYRLRKWSATRTPTGAFYLLDTAATNGSRGKPPGFDDLGNRHKLVYLSRSELGPFIG